MRVSGSAVQKSLGAFRLTPEYINALRRGEDTSAVARSTMLQSGTLSLYNLNNPITSCGVLPPVWRERHVVPLTKLGGLTAAHLMNSIDRFMPFHCLSDTPLLKRVWRAIVALIADQASSNTVHGRKMNTPTPHTNNINNKTNKP
jgi:hypothetical protein